MGFPLVCSYFCNLKITLQDHLQFLRILNFYCRTEPSSSGGSNHDRLSDLKIIDQMLKTYDRRATPTNKIGQPTRVECELFIRSFGSISEKTMVSLYLMEFLAAGIAKAALGTTFGLCPQVISKSCLRFKVS